MVTINKISECGIVQMQMTKGSSYTDLWCINLLLCAHYNWHKSKLNDDGTHLVVTPARLKPSQTGLGS